MATILKDVVRVIDTAVDGAVKARPDTTSKAKQIRIVVEADNDEFIIMIEY